MYARIIVKNVPVLGDVQFHADLPAGFIGPAIGEVLDQAFSAKLLGPRKYSTVVKVLLNKDSSASGSTIPLIGEDLIPDGYYVTVPTFDVLCEWPAVGDEDDEFERAFDRMGVLFADDSVKPILACPLAEQIAKGLPPGRAPVSASSQTELVARVEVAPTRLKVYFSSAVHEEYRGGDADFMKSMVDGLRAIGVDAVRLANTRLTMGPEQLDQKSEGKLVTLDYYKGLTDEQCKIGADNLPLQVQATIDCMLGYFAEERRNHPDIVPVLHIQSRLPGSGSAFADPATIRRFRDAGVKVFVTVHEWLYNLKHLPERAKVVHGSTHASCVSADGAVFVNDLDYADANVAGAAFMPIPITVAFESIDVEAVLARPNRVMMFGLLRPGKGFDQAIKLGEKLLEKYMPLYADERRPDEHEWSVWVVGKLTGAYNDFEGLVKSVFREAIYKTVFPVAGWMKALDARLHDDDDAFNNEVIDKLRQCEALRTAQYKKFRENPYRPKATIESDKKALIKPVVSKGNSLLLRVSEKNMLARAMVAAVANTFAALTDSQRSTFDLTAEHHSALLEEGHRPHAAELGGLVRELLLIDVWKSRFDLLQTELAQWEAMPLPVFFKLNLTEPELIDTFKQCKYVYKPDDKGMADNASAMISPMANGCILFTSWGVVTPAEFISAESGRVSAGTPERYKLDFDGRYAKSIVLSKKGQSMLPEAVIDEILARESDSNVTNRATLDSLKHLTEHRYLPIMVAARHVIYYRRRIFGDPRTILIPQEEHQ